MLGHFNVLNMNSVDFAYLVLVYMTDLVYVGFADVVVPLQLQQNDNDGHTSKYLPMLLNIAPQYEV